MKKKKENSGNSYLNNEGDTLSRIKNKNERDTWKRPTWGNKLNKEIKQKYIHNMQSVFFPL